VIGKDLIDDGGFFARRYDATQGATYLVRPDQHLAARWRHFDPSAIERASRRLRGQCQSAEHS
jgi:3-(3-hydroxy-phenyl)propionate hydroxylase